MAIRSCAACRPRSARVPCLPGLGEAYQLTDTEGGRRLSFSKFNCAYEIEVICETSCDADRELLDMASDMAVINAR